MMISSQLSLLTRQLSRVSLAQQSPLLRPLPAVSQLATVRPFASKKKSSPKSKSNQKRKAAGASSRGGNAPTEAPVESASHQEWIKFQNSIAVDGFETGQIMTAARTGKTQRGGKAARGKDRSRAALNEKLAERQRLFEAGGGQYPPLRYEDSETERLLAEAYAAIPERAGKRGTRNLKRQSNRWFLVRQIRSKYKYHMANFQERKMEKRKERMAQVRESLDVAPGIRAADRAYQAQIFQRWVASMALNQGKGIPNVESIDQGKKQEV